jgi:hypothetical protein
MEAAFGEQYKGIKAGIADYDFDMALEALNKAMQPGGLE